MDDAGTTETFQLGCRPAKQGPRPLSRNQGRVEKLVTGSTMMKKTRILPQGNKQLQLCNKLRPGTWNICSMLQLGSVQLLSEEITRLGVDMWVVRGEMGWTRAFHNTGCTQKSILRST